MPVGGDSHAQGVALFGQRLPGVEDLEVEFRAHLFGGLLLHVEDADHLSAGIGGVKPGMMTAQGPDADDADLYFPQFLHENPLFRIAFLIK